VDVMLTSVRYYTYAVDKMAVYERSSVTIGKIVGNLCQFCDAAESLGKLNK